MLQPQFVLGLNAELVIDLFAGGGGASTGIEQAIGRHVDIAVNHDPQAIALHTINHPQTRHFCSDVFEVDPLEVTDGQPVGLLWASPDCKHFSKAKGGKPVSKKIRGLAWVVIKWAKLAQPRQIYLENVEEFQDWGPLTADGMPCAVRKGMTFRRWKAQLENLGYVVEHREMRACDYGAPTIRKRLYLIARRDGLPIVWPKPTHAKNPEKGSALKPWRTAADCIDWSIPCPSIFERERELAPATKRRIAHGIQRYVLSNPRPFIVPVTHQGSIRVHSIDEPLRTVTSAKRGEFSLISPTVAAFMAQHNTGVVGHHMTEPVSTIVGKGCTQALVSAHITKFRSGSVGSALDEPLPTVTAGGEQTRPGTGNAMGLVTSNMVKLRGTSNSAATDAPLGTISAGGQHHAEVRAFLIKYYGTDQDPDLREPLHTITTKDRFGVVTVKGQDYVIADIGMRMLQPRELYTAQGFPASYIIDHTELGPLPKHAQVRMCGNSVCPPVAAAIVRANYVDASQLRRAA